MRVIVSITFVVLFSQFAFSQTKLTAKKFGMTKVEFSEKIKALPVVNAEWEKGTKLLRQGRIILLGSLVGITSIGVLVHGTEMPSAYPIGILAGGILAGYQGLKGRILMNNATFKFRDHYFPKASIGLSSNGVGLIISF